jgi:hypothetical protein
MQKKRIKMEDGSEFTVFYLKPEPVKMNDKMPNKAGKVFELDKLSPKYNSILYKIFFGNSNQNSQNNWDI